MSHQQQQQQQQQPPIHPIRRGGGLFSEVARVSEAFQNLSDVALTVVGGPVDEENPEPFNDEEEKEPFRRRTTHRNSVRNVTPLRQVFCSQCTTCIVALLLFATACIFFIVKSNSALLLADKYLELSITNLENEENYRNDAVARCLAAANIKTTLSKNLTESVLSYPAAEIIEN